MFISGSIWNRVHTFYLTMITQNSWELVKSTIFLLCPSTDFFLLFRTSYLVEKHHSVISSFIFLCCHSTWLSSPIILIFSPWTINWLYFQILYLGEVYFTESSLEVSVSHWVQMLPYFCWFPVIFLWAQDRSKLPLSLSPDGIIRYNSCWFGYINYRKLLLPCVFSFSNIFSGFHLERKILS